MNYSFSNNDDFKTIWRHSRDRLLEAVRSLGFPDDLGNAIVKNLGSPKAMDRMTVYLENIKPKKAELVVDEMLAIMSDIEAWRERKASREANAAYNDIMYYGLDNDEV